MFELPVDRRTAKEAFLVAQRMKAPFDSNTFRERLRQARSEVAAMSEESLNEALIPEGDKRYTHRRDCLSSGEWKLTVIDLASCQVWAKGLVPTMASTTPAGEGYRKHDPGAIPLTILALPMIVLSRNSCETQYRIDDGCNRAVTYFAAGFREALAFVGKVPPELNHKWKWPK